MEIPELIKVKNVRIDMTTGTVKFTADIINIVDLSRIDPDKEYHLGLSETNPDPVPEFNQ